jgi:adenylosuccinate synthase
MSSNHLAHAVIGAGYGDEGKGLVVDALAARVDGNATVARFNGGAQAGHTVTTPDGRRHVFHHVGAGAFAGASTFLTRFFIVNPILFLRELDDLAGLGANLATAVDPRAPVTLPFDMMINQIAERARGAARHGSCGLGIGETIERGLRPEFAVTVADLGDRKKLGEILTRARLGWVFERLRALGVRDVSAADRALLADEAIDARWIEDAERFMAAITPSSSPPSDRPLIFEGAQGLKLDQTRGDFPYVTRSNTGCRNVVELAREWGIEALELIYVSRVYRTRHGAGPLAREYSVPPPWRQVDETNVPNPWQGAMRHAPLDLDELAADIGSDRRDAEAPRRVTTALAMTCLDQVEGKIEVVRDGLVRRLSPEAIVVAAAGKLDAGRVLASQGPTRETFAE